MEPYLVLDRYGGHVIYEDCAEPANLELYHQHIRRRAIEVVQLDLLEAMDREFYDAEAIYFSQTAIRVHEEIIRLTRDPAAYNGSTFGCRLSGSEPEHEEEHHLLQHQRTYMFMSPHQYL